MSISICITTYNRSDLTIESFSRVYDHPLVSEIIIVDDASEDEIWVDLLSKCATHPATDKIKRFRNKENLGMSRNKREAVSKATNKWVILFDSDNILYPEYLNAIELIKDNLNPSLIYHPIKAEPDYDFSLIDQFLIHKANAKDYLHIREFRVFLNCCNFFVNRDKYLETYEYNPEIRESDSIWFNFLWLKSSKAFWFIRGMTYFHRRHGGSGWLTGDHEYNLKMADEIQEKIKNL